MKTIAALILLALFGLPTVSSGSDDSKSYWSVETSDLKSFANDPTETAKRIKELRGVEGVWKVTSKGRDWTLTLAPTVKQASNSQLDLGGKFRSSSVDYDVSGFLKPNGKLRLSLGTNGGQLSGVIDAKAMEGWGDLVFEGKTFSVQYRKAK